ncbi:Bifunctional arginine demethylase and lysyl-hydroxylase psr-1 (Phosphatidylserine receptor 1) [Durusdinium trenchii]
MIPWSHGIARVLRVNAVALIGSDAQATRELFKLLDAGAASDYRYAKALLQGRPSLPWLRSWQEKRADPQLYWAHPLSHASGAPDLYTPLSSVLLASPRHRLAAMLQKWGLAEAFHTGVAGVPPEAAVTSLSHKKAALQFLELPVTSLGGLTARRVKDLGPNGNPGEAARSAMAEWRWEASNLLLDSLAGRALLSFADYRGRTALHHAASSGDVQVIELLLKAGAEKGTKDQQGRSPAHLAAVYRHKNAAALLAEGADTGCDAYGHSVESILDSQALKEVPEVSAEDISMESDFIASYVSLNRPVLIKGGAMHLEAMSWSDYRHLLMDMGSEVVQAAPVPYSKNMGLLGAMEAPLSELLSSPKIWRSEEADEKAASEPPSYVFDASVLRRRRDLVKKASALTTSFMERHCSHVRVPQFGVGFRGAGAPMHTHHAALNASFAGRKRWLLCPPEAASWDLEPVCSWWQSDRYQRQRESGLLLEFQQEPGDLLFVPEGWGHATILESYAVGVAQEFVPWSSING